MSSEEFSSRFDQYHSRFRMTDVESYRHDGQQYYAGIWVENRNGREWYEQRGLSSKGFGELWSELRDLGFRLVDYEVYPSSDGWEYAGIWRQNGDRYDWPLRCAVDRLLKEEVAENEIPGMSVAIAQNGRWRYLRGFGYADVDDSVDADSRTVYRLASVSKAVAGVLALRLVEDETVSLDLGAPTRDYVADMPVHHTHTVSQTLSNWAGIGHYSDDYPDYKEWIDADYDPDADEDEEGADDNFEPDHFDTALAAARTMWHAPLSYPPPGSTYSYSSFGFTFAGAALEGAAGESVPTLLRDHLRVPFELSTLRPDRNGPDPKRSLIYGDSNQEKSPDDTSWKLLGGGLEGSAYDLARLGNGLVDGTILTSESREVLWSPADGQVTYGLGWDIATFDDRQVVLHTGHQAGANSYLLIYPDEEIVIVLLSNRRRGHETAPMGIEIGRLMIDALAVGGAENQLLSPAQVLAPDEPDTEGLPPEYVVWPTSDPVTGVEDFTEPVPDLTGETRSFLYLPLLSN